MDFSKITENKPLLYGIIGGVVLILVLVIVGAMVAASGSKDDSKNVVGGEPLKSNVDLLTTDNLVKVEQFLAFNTSLDFVPSN